MAAIECDGFSAVVAFPAKVVKRVCAWCKGELGEKEIDSTYDASDTHGICDACALQQLPQHLHEEWKRVRAIGGLEAIGDEPLRVGERVFKGVP